MTHVKVKRKQYNVNVKFVGASKAKKICLFKKQICLFAITFGCFIGQRKRRRQNVQCPQLAAERRVTRPVRGLIPFIFRLTKRRY